MKKRIVGVMMVIAMMGMLLLGVTGCSQKTEKSEGGTVKIATKPITESLIIGEMMKQLIEADTNLTVELTKGVGGGTSNIHPAMVSGEFDVYSEYTGTSWYTVLKKTETPDEDTLYKELAKEYNDQFGLKWIGLYGFNNTYSFAMRKEDAEAKNIKTFSDLAKNAQDYVFGANPDFMEREDGFPGVSSAYGFKFKSTSEMDVGLKYQALKNKEVDVIPVFTTDGQLSDDTLTILSDDQKYFKNYFCGTVARNDVLEKYPELEEELKKLDDCIDNEAMSKMNNDVEINGKEDSQVAKDFLTEKGLLK